MNYHSACPGIFTQGFNSKRFAVFVLAEINVYAYFNDSPLLMRSLSPTFGEYQNIQPEIVVDGAVVNNAFVPNDALDNAITSIIADSNTLVDKLINLNSENADINQIDCPTNSVEFQTVPNEVSISVTDDQGQLIDTVTTDLNDRETSTCSTYGDTQTIASFMNNIPKDIGDLSPSEPSLVCSMPDGNLKLKLLGALNGTTGSVNEFLASVDAYSNSLQNYAQDTLNQLPTSGQILPGDPSEWLSNTIDSTPEELTKTYDQYYGIPLIELDVGAVGDGSDSMILQVNTHPDIGWKLELSNIGMLFNDPDHKMIIDKTVPPGVKFLAGFVTDGITHTIALQIQLPNEPMLTKTIRKPHNYSINCIGTDSNQLKHLCGFIHDIWVWDWQKSIPTDAPPPINIGMPPFPYGALAFYDFYYARVIHNLVHDQKGLLKPIRIGGVKDLEWTTFSDDISTEWKFMQNGYLEDFFCRRRFLKTSWSIIWHHQVNQWGSKREYLISDDVNHNYLYYDYTTFEFVIKFNGTLFRKFRVIPPKRWAQYSLRYDAGTGDITLGIIDFEIGHLENYTVNIGTNLQFELMSMLARYDSTTKSYQDRFNCSFGMLMLFDNYQDDLFVEKFYNEQNYIIRQLEPYA